MVKLYLYLNDDGSIVEPEYYIPIIPFALINGISGIGTGFSCNIPAFNPLDMIRYLKHCDSGGDEKKVRAFKTFIESKSDTILICTHATLRFAFNQSDISVFNDTLLAIDEFHHVSAAIENRLGEVLNKVMSKTNAHIIAMTGSYFRGDNIPVLLPEDEIK